MNRDIHARTGLPLPEGMSHFFPIEALPHHENDSIFKKKGVGRPRDDEDSDDDVRKITSRFSSSFPLMQSTY